MQSYFISVDNSFYCNNLKVGCKVMTRSINEELGQVEYVFSDKTGTLTCNVMELKYLTIGNSTYEGKLTEKTSEHNKYAIVGGYFSNELALNLKNTSQLEKPIQVYSNDKAV